MQNPFIRSQEQVSNPVWTVIDEIIPEVVWIDPLGNVARVLALIGKIAQNAAEVEMTPFHVALPTGIKPTHLILSVNGTLAKIDITKPEPVVRRGLIAFLNTFANPESGEVNHAKDPT